MAFSRATFMLERWLSAQAAAQPAAAQDEPAADHVAHNADQAAQAALRATVAADNPLSGRQLAERFGLNRAQVASVRNAVLPSNGHSLGGGENHAAQASA